MTIKYIFYVMFSIGFVGILHTSKNVNKNLFPFVSTDKTGKTFRYDYEGPNNGNGIYKFATGWKAIIHKSGYARLKSPNGDEYEKHQSSRIRKIRKKDKNVNLADMMKGLESICTEGDNELIMLSQMLPR